ncbi:signal peptide peptidase-domain-containing protein [Multifurca ochricompacta]|uniref:Signal peptide peptidase-domain-containing protein n=1 Tax=Multifurca ochricompacta TaxID=376703 RepID=A0AAD4QQS9_9AGAM|nr:signal peptide peptidase-domain-containing protein [Multifurca ochricompacta]
MPDGLSADLLFAYVGIITTATISICAGSFGTLPNPKGPSKTPDDSKDEDDLSPRLTSEEAWLFPLLGSVLLAGLFLVIKYFGKEWINWLMSLYFSLAGLYSVPHSFISLAKLTFGAQRWSRFERYQVKVVNGSGDVATLSCRTPSLFLAPLGMIPSLLYVFYSGPKKSMLLTNILALSFGHDAMSMLRIDSFKTGSILLSGLFIYDVWWVFGTKVMVSVATSLDLPMKILWPKSANFSVKNGSMMLGLGDIVVPGTFVSLALRYDYFRYMKVQPAGPFTKPYFIATVVAYVAGLATTMVVMHVFRAAQPALLYLSPACILSLVLTAWCRGELIEVWRWKDGGATTSQNGNVDSKPVIDAAGKGSPESSDATGSREGEGED